MAHFDRSLYLCFRDDCGPWLALRAALLLPAGTVTAPDRALEVPHPCSEQARQEMRKRLQVALKHSREGADRATVKNAFMHMRLATDVGMDYEYTDVQMRYHYMQDTAILRELLAVE
ncbi:MAG: hypothetical protein MHM6MM_007048 [Cercozoa sp. M6MM]